MSHIFSICKLMRISLRTPSDSEYTIFIAQTTRRYENCNNLKPSLHIRATPVHEFNQFPVRINLRYNLASHSIYTVRRRDEQSSTTTPQFCDVCLMVGWRAPSRLVIAPNEKYILSHIYIYNAQKTHISHIYAYHHEMNASGVAFWLCGGIATERRRRSLAALSPHKNL